MDQVQLGIRRERGGWFVIEPAAAAPPPAQDAAREELRGALQAAALGEYEVYGELGRGGMATVYLAHDVALDRLVAIKVLDPALSLDHGMVERFKREARTAAQLTHPHIIPVYAVRQTERLVYFVMRYVEGRSLDGVIRELGPLPIDMIQTILHQVGGALAHAHRKGVVHRDVKPANIMIDTDGWAVVTDFGIAKVLEASGLTSTGSAVGTPYYMSPEQYSSAAITGKADQYSLGIVAWEMLTGTPPFQGSSLMEVMRAQCFDEVPSVLAHRPDCPPPLAEMVARMLAKKPEARFVDLDEVTGMLATGPMALDHPVRLRMITLAKSGAKRPMIPPPPTSPIPASRVAAAGAFRAGWLASWGRWAALTVLLAGGGTAGYLAWSGRGSGEGGAPGVQPTGRSEVQAATPDSNRAVETQPVPAPPPAPVSAPASPPPPPTSRPPATRPSPRGGQSDGRAAAALSGETPPGESSRDSTASAPPVETRGFIQLGTRHPGAYVYLNGRIQTTPNPSLRWWPVPPGQVRLAVQADGCEPWEQVVTVGPGDSVSIGNRFPTCRSPRP